LSPGIAQAGRLEIRAAGPWISSEIVYGSLNASEDAFLLMTISYKCAEFP
jgi:hypothetical protein